MWKQIIKKSPEITKKHIIFVTSDTKPDWFHKSNQNEVVKPREELISEFKHYNREKEVIIIPFENFIEEISDLSDQSDRDLLLELRMSNLVKRLSQDSMKKIIDEKIKLVGIHDLLKKVIQSSSSMERQYVQTVEEISHPYIETVTVNTNGIKIEENEVIYFLNIIAECEFPTISYNSNIISYGGIHTEITLSVELRRNLEENEVTFINAFKENPSAIATVTHFIVDKEEYIWGSDAESSEDDEDDFIETGAYTTCPSCSRGITSSNDAGNGFCIHCPQ